MLSVEDIAGLADFLIEAPIPNPIDSSPIAASGVYDWPQLQQIANTLAPAVEAIVARRVAAALNEAADAVRAACPGDHLRQPCSSCCGAARLVRARAARTAAAP